MNEAVTHPIETSFSWHGIESKWRFFKHCAGQSQHMAQVVVKLGSHQVALNVGNLGENICQIKSNQIIFI